MELKSAVPFELPITCPMHPWHSFPLAGFLMSEALSGISLLKCPVVSRGAADMKDSTLWAGANDRETLRPGRTKLPFWAAFPFWSNI